MKNARRLTFAIAASLALAACGLTPEEQFARAQESYAAHNYAEARLDLISALKEQPTDPAMLELLARTLIAMGDGEGAIAALERLAAARGDASQAMPLLRAEAEILRGRFEAALGIVKGLELPDAHRLAALAHIGLEQPELALAQLEAGLDSGGESAALLATFARFELGRGEIAAAERRASEALQADSGLLDAMLVSGEIAIAQNKLPAALAHYEKAYTDYPQSLAALLGKAAILGDMGRLDEAGDLIDKAAATAPDNPRVVQLQARLAVERKDWARARSLLQGQEAAVRQDPAMQVTYATALLRLGQFEQAQALLRPLVTRYPGMRSPRLLLAEAQLAGKDGKSALATIRPLAERPDASPAELQIASKAARLAGDPAANSYAQRARLPAPEWIGGELAKGDSALRNRQWHKAIESYEAIVARSRTPNALVLNNLAYAKSQAGQKDEATELALRALSLQPDHASIMDTAGWLLVETGRDRKRGVELLRKASQLEPDNTGIANRLAAARRG
jgi:tetratricopeptide (TPR) repeat protein